MIEGIPREQVWFSPLPVAAYPGVVIWRRFGFVRVLYWDTDGEHYRTTLFLPSKDLLFPRVAELWSVSCGSMARPPRS